MTDLTTMRLKCLLEQATPGPWEYEGSQFQEITALDDAELEYPVISLDRYTDKELCNRPADMNLAAHAPQLAEEVLRMRNELTSLQEEARSAAKIHATGPAAQRVFDALDTTINQILGETDD